MEYFKSSLKSVLGTAPAGTQPTGADTVERLVDRLQSSTLLDDRRDACRALKAFSRTYRVEVGAQGMDALRQVLEMDRTDCEIIGLALDTLCNITNPEAFDEELDNHGSKNQIGEQFTEIFIKNSDSVGLVLTFLEEFDFRVRWPALKLLMNLLANRSKDIQEIILVSPMGVSKLMDLLSDSREVIRNDVLLLLIQLTKGNANIQKIVAFENAFDRIFDVIEQEGNADGGIVVEDCLLLMLNLLRGNFSNQNFFKEGSYIQKLTPMFQIPNETEDNNLGNGWSPQKVSNVHCMVQVVRALVAPSAPAQAVAACQRIMRACELLQALCDILMASGVPADVLTETINTVAEVIRGNTSNQEFLAGVMAPSIPPRPAIVVLLMSMVNEKQPFVLRCSVLYCFQCFLYKNEVGQMQLIQTLLPQGNEAPSLTTGQLLCGGLFSTDSVSNWFSAVALSHALIENSQKEQLLRVLLATNIGKPPVTLMQQCVMLLQQGNKTQCKLGLLILLCRWISYCPLAVKSFLAIESSVAYLMALLSSQENNDDLQEILLQSMCALLIGICVHFNDNSVPTYTKEKMCNLIENRIGFEKFQDAIGGIARHEIYSRTLKHPQSSAKNPSELLLDYEFCRLLKSLEGVIIKSVIDVNNEHQNKNQLSVMNLPDNILVTQYKDLIRDQDTQIQKLNQANNCLTKEKQDLEAQIEDLRSTVSHLRDQNLVLRAAQANIGDGKETITSSNNLDLEKELQTYKIMVADLENRLAEYTYIVQQHNEKNKENRESELEYQLKLKTDELEKLKKDQEDLLELMTDQDNKITLYRERLIELGDKVESDESSGELDTDDQPESSN
ncbi:hypothetical protein PUN28_005389 [Cardiocondyla obscurior]|uniref:General vesicular transport factor p115 n=1 Tax=Cardiocondyla obscurior TaxID=286306 RepID=A0AAW2GHH7_9HYME